MGFSKGNCKSTRRFQIDAILVIVGLSCLVVSLVLEMKFGYFHNHSWNKVLRCALPFPDSITGDTIFGGRKLECPPSSHAHAVYRRGFKRESDNDFALFPIFIILGIGIFLCLPPLVSNKFRVGGYLSFFELSFGMLGMMCMGIYLLITFSLSEYQSNLSLIINAHHERYEFFRAVQPRPLCEEGVELGTEVCPQLETWLLTAIKCVLNRASDSVSQQIHLKSGIESKLANLKDKPMTFQGSNVKYGENELELLGFCHYDLHREMSKAMILVAIACFFLINVVPCCIKTPPAEGFEEAESEDEEEVLKSPVKVGVPPRRNSSQSVITIGVYPSMSLMARGRKDQESQWMLLTDKDSTSVQIGTEPPSVSALNEPTKMSIKKKKKNSSDKPNKKPPRLSDEHPPEEPKMHFGDEDERRWSLESRVNIQSLKKRQNKRRKSKSENK